MARGEDPQARAAIGTLQHIDREHTAQQIRPGVATRRRGAVTVSETTNETRRGE
jgi:hypothetical protein